MMACVVRLSEPGNPTKPTMRPSDRAKPLGKSWYVTTIHEFRFSPKLTASSAVLGPTDIHLAP